jgi:signal transduction histidine kinase
LIKDPQQPVDKLRRRIATATRQSDRLKALIDGLLDVSRIEMGRLQLEPADVDVGDLVREVVERADADAARAGSTITAQLPVTVAARVDRMRIDQVLTNLLSNAIKYGGGKPIEVSLGEDGDQLSLAVRDHGVGIAAQDLTRIFGRFERAVESSHYGGLGLGLYIANQMVIAHGGTIVASSPPGQGATFTIRIPRRT